jgi:chromosome segregation ATPase
MGVPSALEELSRQSQAHREQVAELRRSLASSEERRASLEARIHMMEKDHAYTFEITRDDFQRTLTVRKNVEDDLRRENQELRRDVDRVNQELARVNQLHSGCGVLHSQIRELEMRLNSAIRDHSACAVQKSRLQEVEIQLGVARQQLVEMNNLRTAYETVRDDYLRTRAQRDQADERLRECRCNRR